MLSEKTNITPNAHSIATTDDDTEGVGSSFLWVFSSWSQGCSAHGFPRVIGSKNYYRRIFWFAASLTSTILFFYQTYVMLEDVFKFPVTVNLEAKYWTQIEMPFVTVCNSNKLKSSAVQQNMDRRSSLYYAAKFQNYNSVGVSSVEDELKTLKYNSSLDERDPGEGCGNNFVVDWTNDQSILQRKNQVRLACDDKESCYPQSAQCQDTGACPDGSDSSFERCGECDTNFYQCHNKECIRPELRCDGNLDCTDGSDEFSKYCDPEKTKNYFVCCTSNVLLPLSKLCDDYDDCPRDKSDQYLYSCQSKTGSLMCMAPKQPGSGEQIITISRSQVGDGRKDCEDEVDETCAWKYRRSNWVDPFLTRDYEVYSKFIDLLGTEPAAARWYTMASPEQIKQMGHKLANMIISCVNNNQMCNETITVLQSPSQDYGMCYHFQQKFQVNSSGPAYGLQVVFNLESYESIGLFTANGGLKVFFTAPGKLDQNGEIVVDWTSELNLSPGFDHAIKLHPQEITKKGKPYSDCEEYGTGDLEGFNTRDDCQRFCLLRVMAETCGCVDDVWMRQSRLCNLTDDVGMDCVDNLKAKIDLSSVCECPNACSMKTYDVSTTKSDWPTKLSFPRFLAIVYSSAKDDPGLRDFLLNVIEEYNAEKDSVESDAITAIRSSFGRFTVYFPDRSFEIVTERPVYTFVSILSSLGGLLGLYLGFSALTLLELVDLCIDSWQFMALKKRKEKC